MKKFEKEELKLDKALRKEWLITNGIGGFASSTIVGCNTRKYHGLLVAPFAAPGRRKLILSKVDESLEIEGLSPGKVLVYRQGSKILNPIIREKFSKFVTKLCR